MNFIYKRIFSSRAVQEPSLHPLSSSHMKLETSEKRRATSLGWGRQCEENLSKRKLIINGTSDEFEYESIEVFRFIFLLVLGPSRALIGWSGRRRIQLEGFQRSSALPCRKPKRQDCSQRDQSLLFKWILRRPRGHPPRCTNCVMARHSTVRNIEACTGYDIDSMILESRFRDAPTCIVDAYSRCLGGVDVRCNARPRILQRWELRL